MHIIFFLLACLFIDQSHSNSVLFASFSGTNPLTYVDLHSPAINTVLTMTLTCNEEILGLRFVYCTGADFTVMNCPDRSQGLNAYAATLTRTVNSNAHYWMVVYGETDSYIECTATVLANGRSYVTHPLTVFYSTINLIHKIEVTGPCAINYTYTGQPASQILLCTPAQMLDEDCLASATQRNIALNQGIYYFIVMPLSDPTQLTPYSFQVMTSCDNLCVDPNRPPPVCAVCGNGILERGEQCDNGNKTGCENCRTASGYACYGQIGSGSICTKQKAAVCGDGILDYGEQCDNGNKPGCSGCKVAAGYDCKGNIGGTSICSKSPVCGDGVLDQGEQCDNGNKLGCSFNCQVDAGFNCVSSIGFPSVCGFCGNGIVEPGEECDNKNSLGCSQNCKVDVGFSCRGLSTSFCFRNNPICGNGLSQVGEACDDGNKLAGDGCGSTCLIEQGYTCTGEPSKCSKKPADAPVCGNGKFEPSNEQCDNGNKDGCLKCVVQSGWSCASRVGLPSVCLPKVVVPHCGNGVHEPQQSEVCDDGNINNGDGCDNFCQVEFGWVCIDGKKCINTQDPTQVKVLCGNGKVQRLYGETCDDGNTANGDGCSGGCKVEGGWSCRVFSPEENRSYCRRETNGSGFCGNGVLDGNEECDDGFPLRNGDGCSIGCRIEPGWSCGSISFSQVSKCWKL